MSYTHYTMKLKNGQTTTVHKDNAQQYRDLGFEIGAPSKGAARWDKEEAIRNDTSGSNWKDNGYNDGSVNFRDKESGNLKSVNARYADKYFDRGDTLDDSSQSVNRALQSEFFKTHDRAQVAVNEGDYNPNKSYIQPGTRDEGGYRFSGGDGRTAEAGYFQPQEDENTAKYEAMNRLLYGFNKDENSQNDTYTQMLSSLGLDQNADPGMLDTIRRASANEMYGGDFNQKINPGKGMDREVGAGYGDTPLMNGQAIDPNGNPVINPYQVDEDGKLIDKVNQEGMLLNPDGSLNQDALYAAPGLQQVLATGQDEEGVSPDGLDPDSLIMISEGVYVTRDTEQSGGRVVVVNDQAYQLSEKDYERYMLETLGFGTMDMNPYQGEVQIGGSMQFNSPSAPTQQETNARHQAILKQLTTEAARQAQANIAGSSSGSGSAASGVYSNGTKEQFMHQDLKKQTPMTTQQVDAWINSKLPKGKDSIMAGTGAAFVQAASESGLDVRYLVAHAAHETGWGTSNIAKKKGNMFGIGAYDSSPMASAYKYGNTNSGIIEGAKWIAKNYVDKGQNTINKMRWNGGSHEYATDKMWDTKIANIMTGAPVGNKPSSGGGTSGKASSFVDNARSMLGFSYSQKNRMGSSSVDCSSLVGRAMKMAGITDNSFVTTDSITTDKRFQKIKKSEARAGDIMWQKGHVAINIGNGKLIEASSSNKKVVESTLGNRFTHAYRIKGL